MSVAKRLGCVSLRPNVVFFDDEESKNSALAVFSKKRKTCFVDIGLDDGHNMRNRELVDEFCGRKSEGTGGEAVSVTEIVSSLIYDPTIAKCKLDPTFSTLKSNQSSRTVASQ
jgi:hypothetical protein